MRLFTSFEGIPGCYEIDCGMLALAWARIFPLRPPLVPTDAPAPVSCGENTLDDDA